MSKWTLFSNHGHVLLFLSQDPEVRLRDVAERVGITERAVQKIVRDLQDGGMLTVTKHGRRNRYRIHLSAHLRHELEAHCTVGQLTNLVNGTSTHGPEATPAEPVAFPETGSVATPVKETESAPEPPPKSPSEPEPAGPAVPDNEPSKPDRAGRKPARDPGEQGSLF